VTKTYWIKDMQILDVSLKRLPGKNANILKHRLLKQTLLLTIFVFRFVSQKAIIRMLAKRL